MTNSVWDVKDHKGDYLPTPVHWHSNPEWFSSIGSALRIPGPRVNPHSDKPWHWGPTEWVCDLGEYTVMAYRQDRSTFKLSDQRDHGKLCYVAWVYGAELDVTWESLDEVLVDMVRFKYEGPRGSSGPRATEYFLKMVEPS